MSSCAPGVELCTRCQTVHWVHVRPSPSVSVRSVRPFVRPSVRPFVRRPSVRPSVRSSVRSSVRPWLPVDCVSRSSTWADTPTHVAVGPHQKRGVTDIARTAVFIRAMCAVSRKL